MARLAETGCTGNLDLACRFDSTLVPDCCNTAASYLCTNSSDTAHCHPDSYCNSNSACSIRRQLLCSIDFHRHILLSHWQSYASLYYSFAMMKPYRVALVVFRCIVFGFCSVVLGRMIAAIVVA